MTFINDKLQENQKLMNDKVASESRNNRDFARFKFDPSEIMKLLRQRIIGQNAALNSIEDMLKVIKADFNNPTRPLSVTFMVGPTGVGKTETVRIISECIYGRSNAFCHIDMNTLAQEHYAASITGAPPGYVGSKEGHTLFDIDAINGSFSQPGIVLFDEIEKADKTVIRSLMNILETGKLKLTSGTKELDFRNSMIFMTSNIGATKSQNRLIYLEKLPNLFSKLAIKFKQDENSIIERAMMQYFDPEFLNRIDRILYYKRIEFNITPQLVIIELNKLNQRMKKQNRSVSLSDSALNALSKGYDLKYGARGIERNLRVKLEPIIADFLLTNSNTKEIEIDFNDNTNSFFASERKNNNGSLRDCK